MSEHESSEELPELSTLPAELILHILAASSSISQLGRCLCVCHQFGSLVELVLRQRSQHVESAARPAAEASCVQWLCWLERRATSVKHRVAAGKMHSVMTHHGQLHTCGIDAHALGFLGHGEQLNVTSPAPTPTLDVRIVAVAAHSMHCLALTHGGALYTFGDGNFGQVTASLSPLTLHPSPFTLTHTLTFTLTRTLHGATTSASQLGHGTTEHLSSPTLVETLADEVLVAVAAGQQHSLALSKDGTVYSFGSGFQGKLGHRTQNAEHLPRRIAQLEAERAVAIAAGEQHSLVASARGALFTFGYGVTGQLGHGDRQSQLTPKRVDTLAEEVVVDAAGGVSHSLAVSDSGLLYGFGSGDDGRLGLRDQDERLHPARIDCFGAAALGRVLAVATGTAHSLVLVDGGDVYSFGAGGSGRLGHGDEISRWAPTCICMCICTCTCGCWRRDLTVGSHAYQTHMHIHIQVGSHANRRTPCRRQRPGAPRRASGGDCVRGHAQPRCRPRWQGLRLGQFRRRVRPLADGVPASAAR